MILAVVSGLIGVEGLEDLDIEDLDYDINSDLVEVDGYETADGTWVEPYVRTAPNSTVTDNLDWWDLSN